MECLVQHNIERKKPVQENDILHKRGKEGSKLVKCSQFLGMLLLLNLEPLCQLAIFNINFLPKRFKCYFSIFQECRSFTSTLSHHHLSRTTKSMSVSYKFLFKGIVHQFFFSYELDSNSFTCFAARSGAWSLKSSWSAARQRRDTGGKEGAAASRERG